MKLMLGAFLYKAQSKSVDWTVYSAAIFSIWSNFDGRFVGPDFTGANSHGDIFSGNKCGLV